MSLDCDYTPVTGPAIGNDPFSSAATAFERRELAEKAQSFFDTGVDIVIWSMRGPMSALRLAAFAEALATQ